jgi:hypothetical protein
MVDGALAVPTFKEACVDVLVPDATGLTCAINVFQELENVCLFLSLMMKALGNFHVHVAFNIGLWIG